MKKLYLFALGASALIGFGGCEKATIVDQASADVFIQSIKNPNDTSKILYAAVNSVFSYNVMSGVTVSDPSNTTIQLINYAKLGNSFYNDPVYSAIPPAPGNYTYSVTFKDGQVIPYTNTLIANTLIPPQITALGKNMNGDSINISWNAVAYAQAYQLKVTKGKGASATQVFYLAPFIDTSNPLRTNLTVGVSMGSISPYGSGPFTFEIDAIYYESSAYTYIQAIGTSAKDITL